MCGMEFVRERLGERVAEGGWALISWIVSYWLVRMSSTDFAKPIYLSMESFWR